jgi:predicted ATPase with chaperone activity
LLDRIDIHVEVPAVRFQEITAERTGEASAQIRDRVVAARRRQQERFKDQKNITCNARMRQSECASGERRSRLDQAFCKKATSYNSPIKGSNGNTQAAHSHRDCF